jgi:methylated-DNA-protein-cysteine methyltransferase-like protein
MLKHFARLLIKHQSHNKSEHNWRDMVFEYVGQIPPASVCTYGEIAEYLGLTPRMVGSAMRNCPTELPWHRVVASGGRIAIAQRSPELAQLQLQRLTDEGVIIKNLRVIMPERV